MTCACGDEHTDPVHLLLLREFDEWFDEQVGGDSHQHHGDVTFWADLLKRRIAGEIDVMISGAVDDTTVTNDYTSGLKLGWARCSIFIAKRIRSYGRGGR